MANVYNLTFLSDVIVVANLYALTFMSGVLVKPKGMANT